MLNIALVGCGYWGPNLIRNFNSFAECRVKKACDIDKERLKHIKSLYPDVEIVSEFEHLIHDTDIDAIAIATPVRFHFEMAKKSLSTGMHTFIEKPMASSADECRELVEIAQRNSLTLMVGHTYIYSAPIQKMKERFKANSLAAILAIVACAGLLFAVGATKFTNLETTGTMVVGSTLSVTGATTNTGAG